MPAQAFQARQIGDYDVQVITKSIDAERVLIDAEQFVATIKQLLSESNESE